MTDLVCALFFLFPAYVLETNGKIPMRDSWLKKVTSKSKYQSIRETLTYLVVMVVSIFFLSWMSICPKLKRPLIPFQNIVFFFNWDPRKAGPPLRGIGLQEKEAQKG